MMNRMNKQVGQTYNLRNRSDEILEESNLESAIKTRNQTFAETVAGGNVRNSPAKTRIFGNTAADNMPGVRKGGLTDLMMRGKR